MSASAAWRRGRAARAATLACAWRTSPAVLATRGDRAEVLLLSPEPSNPEEGPMRVTRLGKDGPLGHEVGTVAALAERHTDFDSVRPMVEAEVMAWTTAEEYVAGAKAVAFVQADNEVRFVGSRLGRYEEVALTLERARTLYRTDPEAATVMLHGKIAELTKEA